jgi:ribonuclease E
MNAPPFEDDSWSDLAAELGLEAGATPAGSVPPPLPAAEESPTEEPSALHHIPDAQDHDDPDDTVIVPDLQDESTDESGEESAGEGESGAPGEAAPGRKRRRRRRRKKGRGNQPAEEVAESETDEGDDEDDLEADAEEADEAPVLVDPAREVITNWNVPSWESIVSGLYRPDR